MPALSVLLVLYAALWIFKLRSSMGYIRRFEGESSPDYPRLLRELSVLQPIVSGDPRLSRVLEGNLRNNPDLHFIWVIGEQDSAARDIAAALKSAAKNPIDIVLTGEPGEHQNDKVLKQLAGLPHAKKYVLAVDDDTEFTQETLRNIKIADLETKVFSGSPGYHTGGGLFHRLFAGFVNGNLITTYYPMAALGEVHTVNGMFYLTKKEWLQRYRVYETILPYLCDEYELAKILEEKGLQMVQSTLPVKVSTTVRSLKEYLSVMKRWMVFATVYLKGQLRLKTVLLVGLPQMLPLTIVLTAAFLEPLFIPVFLVFHLAKLCAGHRVWQRVNGKKKWTGLLWEGLVDYTTPLHFLHALLSPRKIKWRGRTIDIRSRTIQYRE